MDNTNARSPFTVPALILAVGLLASTVVGAYGFYRVKALSDTISVTGSAQKEITSDVVKWKLSISHSTGLDTVKDGYTSMTHDLGILNDFLKKNKVDPKEITVQPINLTTLTTSYDKGNTPTGYTLTQEVDVESNDVQKVTKLAQDVGALINQDALVSTTSLEYYYSKLSDVKVEMLAQATKDAQMRAQKIAQSAGSGLGKLRSAAMGVLQITPVNSTDVSDYGSYDTTSIQKMITAVVRASFSVN